MMSSETPRDPRISRPEAPEAIECRDPATLEKLGEVPVTTRAELAQRVERARQAQRAWARTSWSERRRVLRALLDYVVEHHERICRIASRDSGKTLVDAAMGEIFPVCEKLRYILAHGERDLSPDPRSSGLFVHKRARVEYEPLGVVGVLCPWNFPFHNVVCPVAPALFAGNAVIAKVSEWTSWSAHEFQAMFDEVLASCGYPTDLVQIVTGTGETGAALCTSGVDKIFFTGSPENGRKVMAQAAETLTPVVLELGGKDPMIVCDDADLDHATGTAMLGVFTACGQMCVAAERVYVFDAIYDRFVERVVKSVGELRQGPPADDPGGRYDVGAMTMPRQIAIIERQIADAVQKGARVLVGGKRNASLAGQFFEPTVVVDCDHTMALVREETFGPVMTILRVKDEDEAVRLANDCRYGLGSSVFTRDPARAERIARRIEAGMVVVNDYGIGYMIQSAPFGGVRASGFGRINGREGLRACCNEKTVVTDRLPIGKATVLYPIRAATFGLLDGAVSLLYGGSTGRRARGLARIVRSGIELLRS